MTTAAGSSQHGAHDVKPLPEQAPWTASLPEPLAEAIAARGFDRPTLVQQAVLSPDLAKRDLRISSQTGSGKTLAIGLVLRDVVTSVGKTSDGTARPGAIVVAPTRELARQVESELAWLYARIPARVASTTGGASYRDETRALARGPAVVVGTPGRLLDHLRRGTVDASRTKAIVLDEADQMLDLGFREELDAIFDHLPPERRTHLVSATFARDVAALANRVQRDAVHVEGTRLGAANTDIDHVLHLVRPDQRFDALVNLLLDRPDDRTLVFARTRADVGHIAGALEDAGFGVAALSGELSQAARTAALERFRRGQLGVLVATDVAARGIDVQGISRVVHTEPPQSPDTYTHRSGRTGRAGRRGTSSMLVTKANVGHAQRVLTRAGVDFRFEPIPAASTIRARRDEQLAEEIASRMATPADPRAMTVARRLLDQADPAAVVAHLVARLRGAAVVEPREVDAVEMSAPARRPERRDAARGDTERFIPFRVSWGAAQGADARRLLAIVCRRGKIRGADVGEIRIERSFSLVSVASEVADAFETAAKRPDRRDKHVTIRRDVPFHGKGRAHGAAKAGSAARERSSVKKPTKRRNTSRTRSN